MVLIVQHVLLFVKRIFVGLIHIALLHQQLSPVIMNFISIAYFPCLYIICF